MKPILIVLTVSIHVFSFFSLNAATRILPALTNDESCDLTKSADEYVSLARNYHAKALYFLATESYSCAIQIDPQRNEFYVLRANVLRVVGQFDRAIDDLRKFELAEPSNSIPHSLLAWVYFDQGHYTDALTEINSALKLKDSQPWNYILQGRIYVGLKDKAKALESFNQYIQTQTNPSVKANGYAEIGFTHQRFGEPIVALFYLKKAAELRPDLGINYLTTAQEDRARSDFVTALDNLNKAIQLTPDLVSAYYERASVYIELKDDDRALNDCNKIVQLQPQATEGYVCRGVVLIDSGKTAQAIDEFNHAIGLDKSFISAYRGKATAELYMGDYNLALSDINVAINAEPLDGINYQIRAEIQTALNRIDEAIADYETYLKLKGGAEINPEIAAKMRQLKARITNL